MEADILKVLKFELGNPTIKTILRYGKWESFCISFLLCIYYAEFDNTLYSFMFLLILGFQEIQ